MLTRTVSGEGRSRAFAGGRSVPVSLLTYLADDLVAVHGQSDQQQLLKPGRQRESLDKYAGGVLAEVLADYQRVYGRHRKVLDELTTLTTQARARAAEAEELRAGLTDIEKLNPAAGEAAALRAEEERLANADSLHAGATTAHEALLGDPTAGNDGVDAVTLLGHARRALDAVRRHDTEIDGVAARLSEAAYLVSEVAGELASYIQGIDADPARLAAVQERRAALARVIRLYGPGGVNAHINGTPVQLGAAAPAPAAEDGAGPDAGDGRRWRGGMRAPPGRTRFSRPRSPTTPRTSWSGRGWPLPGSPSLTTTTTRSPRSPPRRRTWRRRSRTWPAGCPGCAPRRGSGSPATSPPS